ncbi:hypothetical protein EAI_06071 [Harpegnathos saltator]|uniref:Uncharacterized protein n=1 Tax=Harpegnathos saltator TaxID=610380 RepID=E2B4C2_HARSA|nr:hypothetical protein EAI_06071 [Harpegnathos saltator]
MSYQTAAKYMKKSKTFVSKWMNRCVEVKNVDDLPERGSIQKTTDKEDKLILQMFANNIRLLLRGEQAALKEKRSKYIM